MRWSYPIFRVMGISVELHLTFIIFLLLFLAAGLANFLYLALIFTIVLAHELVHSIVARLSGIAVPRITLLPIGGLATIELPENPVLELQISVAGPLFNFFMAFVAFMLLASMGMSVTDYGYMTAKLEDGSLVLNLQHILSLLVWVNFLLGSFNMLPAFPMDGGRVFRSVMALWMDYITATRIALTVGQSIFVLFMIAGIFMGNIWWAVIGFFLFSVGPSELKYVGLRKAFRGVRLGDIASSEVSYVGSMVSVGDFLRMIARPSQRYYPVVDYNGVLRGVLDLEDLKGAGGDFLNSKAVDFSRRDFVMADADEGVEENLKVLLVRDAVLVTHAGKLVGMVTQDDFARAAAFYNLANRSA